MMAQDVKIESRASLNARPFVFPLKKWGGMTRGDGGIEPIPERGTWHALHVKDGAGGVIVPLVGCPLCGKTIILTHSPKAAEVVSKMMGRKVPVAHKIDRLGKVSPDILCMQERCDFHRTVYLDRWDRTKPLYAVAFTRAGSTALEINYCHAVTPAEARSQLGVGKFNIIAVGPAIGFFVDEKTGKVTAEQ